MCIKWWPTDIGARVKTLSPFRDRRSGKPIGLAYAIGLAYGISYFDLVWLRLLPPVLPFLHYQKKRKGGGSKPLHQSENVILKSVFHYFNYWVNVHDKVCK